MAGTLKSSPNALISKKVLDRYLDLEWPEGKCLATYIWIDGSDENVRCKDRTLDSIPKTPKGTYKRVNILLHAIIYNKTWFEKEAENRIAAQIAK